MMSRALGTLMALAAGGSLFWAPPQVSAESSDRVCTAPGPCRTISIRRDAGSPKFLLFDSFTFEPLAHWIEREINEGSEGRFLGFDYDRADQTAACELRVFHYKGPVEPGFDGNWGMFVGELVERGDATIIAVEDDKARLRRSAIVKYKSGRTMQVALRRFEQAANGLVMYELASVEVAALTTAISKSDPDILACHVRPAAI
jgi:hypothetical protein